MTEAEQLALDGAAVAMKPCTLFHYEKLASVGVNIQYTVDPLLQEQ